MNITPGPWKSIMVFSPVRHGCYDVLANDVRIANIIHFGKTDEEAFANARLIAAAPEMVTLLNAALCEMQNPYAEKWITSGTRMVANNIAALLRRIDGEEART